MHLNLGDNWTPVGEVCRSKQLVASGPFRWCRHPLYAATLWATLGALLATMNWVIALGMVPTTVVLLGLKEEERVLVKIFGEQYLEYQERVPALGFPWGCLGFDRRTTNEGARIVSSSQIGQSRMVL